mmetsp:Transcript_1128/g.1337  ORF Transcript_1128/g.1337 Transcript_1128/m.1337 type:complete len:86 (-) Transcript_1128:762-1019(-)
MDKTKNTWLNLGRFLQTLSIHGKRVDMKSKGYNYCCAYMLHNRNCFFKTIHYFENLGYGKAREIISGINKAKTPTQFIFEVSMEV